MHVYTMTRLDYSVTEHHWWLLQCTACSASNTVKITFQAQWCSPRIALNMLQLLHGANATKCMHTHVPSAVQSVSEDDHFWTWSHSKHPAKMLKFRWGCNAVRPCLCTLTQCLAASSPKLLMYAWSRLCQDLHLECIHVVAFADLPCNAWREQFTPAATHEQSSLQTAGGHCPARLTCSVQVQGW